MTTVFSKRVDSKGVPNVSTTSLTSDVPALGAPQKQKRSLFQRSKLVDLGAVATQPSVFDDPSIAEKYHPRQDWYALQPKQQQEKQLVRKLDFRIMVWACVMFMALELDRANISQALTDDLLPELGMDTNDYNMGMTVFRLSFLCAELPSQLLSKWMGPDRWIPMQISLWSIVALSQFGLSGRALFLATRALLGMLQGGFIPDVVIYLSYFYTHAELSIRLAFFWTAMSFADILSAIFAYGLLHMRGIGGHAGWRWLFLIEGLLTFAIGLFSWVLMPAGPCETASWFRGKSGWFSEREEKIIVNRVIREDPSKSTMHNREPVTMRLLWQSLKDYDLWPLYILGLVFQIPMQPQQTYLTLTLKRLGFGVFKSNLLTIPTTILHVITMLGLTYLAEYLGELTLVAVLAQIWALPFLIYTNVVDTTTINRWVVFAVITLLLGYPNPHPIQVAWNSRNSNAVRSRTVSAACYNMFVQGGSIISANMYRADDAPRYARGNRQLLVIVCGNIVIYFLTKAYYVSRNKQRDKKWNSMTEEEQVHYLTTTTEEGNKRLDFRFDH
ncbi:hypothetical protein K4F52_005707 [Lecanicillium sp. MT-2017a]|nr:hypothetical protein K4F52_005707 [Lecanicillium sp. MT-2017a]